MNWLDKYKSKLQSAAQAVETIESGNNVYYGGNAAIPSALVRALAAVAWADGLATAGMVLNPEESIALLESLPGVGKVKARKIMTDVDIADNRRVQGLGAQQKAKLLELLAD